MDIKNCNRLILLKTRTIYTLKLCKVNFFVRVKYGTNNQYKLGKLLNVIEYKWEYFWKDYNIFYSEMEEKVFKK